MATSTSPSLTLSHPRAGTGPGLRELFRVLKAGGALAVFDGDYASTTLACGDHDPIQTCIDAVVAALVHDRWLARRLPSLVKAAGFEIVRFDGHAHVQTWSRAISDAGRPRADALASAETIGRELAEALKAEARRRVEAGGFYGSITFRQPDRAQAGDVDAQSCGPIWTPLTLPGAGERRHVALALALGGGVRRSGARLAEERGAVDRLGEVRVVARPSGRS